MWKEVNVAWLKALFPYLPGRVRETHENLQQEEFASQLKLEPSSFRIQVRSIAAWANILYGSDEHITALQYSSFHQLCGYCVMAYDHLVNTNYIVLMIICECD
jgi:hypothetical protein